MCKCMDMFFNSQAIMVQQFQDTMDTDDDDESDAEVEACSSDADVLGGGAAGMQAVLALSCLIFN